MSEELKSCPFCGDAAGTGTYMDESLFSHAIVEWHWAGCIRCGVKFDSEIPGEAAEQWNTRPTPALDKAREALRETEVITTLLLQDFVSSCDEGEAEHFELCGRRECHQVGCIYRKLQKNGEALALLEKEGV